MPDLEMLLRDVRPAPDPAWAARLDARVAARFPGPPPRWKAPLITLRDHVLAFGVAGAVASMLAALVLVGVHSNGSDDAASSSSGAMKAAAAPHDDSARSAVAPTSAAPRPARVQRKDASLTLSCTPAQVATVTDRAIRVVDGLDGFVQSSEITSGAGASLSLKVPSARLQSALAQLSRLAHVKARSEQTQDLTDQKAALEAAVREARADVAGLRARLAKATTDKERSKLRAQLDAASRRVTRRERAVATLDHQVAYATIDLSIEGDRRSGAAPVKPGDHWTPGDALRAAPARPPPAAGRRAARRAARWRVCAGGCLDMPPALALPLAAIAVLVA